MNGLELAKTIRTNEPNALIIFLTSYSEYVFDVFEVITFDFLLKPITFKRFQKVLQKASTYLNMNKKLFWGIAVAAVIVFSILFFPWKKETAKEEPPKTDNNAKWQEAEHTPYGKYPETVTYTLGKISGGNHSNLPAGDTYEDNGYTRYLKKMLNIQNKDVFELEDGNQYEEAVEIAIKDNNLPDIMVVKGQEMQIETHYRR